MASLSDKDAVYLHKIACPRSLYLQESMIDAVVRSFKLYMKTETFMNFLLFALRLSLSGVSYSSSICQAVDHPGLIAWRSQGASASAIFITHKHNLTSINTLASFDTCNRHMC